MNDGESINYNVRNLPQKSRPLNFRTRKYMEVTVYIYHSLRRSFRNKQFIIFFFVTTQKKNQFIELNAQYNEV